MSTKTNGRPSLKRAGADMQASGVPLPAAIAERMNGKLPKGASCPATTSAREAVKTLAMQPAVQLRLVEIERHPDNRRPMDADVATMAASLHDAHQLEPLVVWKPGGLLSAEGKLARTYQLISGETRLLGALKNGWTAMAARVLEPCDKALALELLALFNAKRTDLDPIQKAKLIKRLCEPVAQGGGGLTQAQAGAIYGLETGAGASNLVRLLALPEVWQQRVASGEFPQANARCLIAYADSPRLMAVLDARYRKDIKEGRYGADCWSDRKECDGHVWRIVRDETRAMKGKRGYNLGEKWGHFWGEYPVLFKVTPELETELELFELKDGKKTITVATNADLFDKLQLPFVQAKAKASKKGKLGASSEDGQPKRKPTAADLKHREKRAEEILEGRVTAWRHRWIRLIVAEELRRDVQGLDWKKVKVLLWLAGQVSFWYQAEETLGLRTELCSALGSLWKPDYENDQPADSDVWEALHAKHRCQAGYHDHLTGLAGVVKGLLVRMFATDDRNPDRPLIPHEVVDGVAADFSIDLAQRWRDLQQADERTDLETFFEMHTSPQLDALGKELHRTVDHLPKKSAKVALLASPPAAGKTMPLPKSIKPLAGEPTGKRKKGAK